MNKYSQRLHSAFGYYTSAVLFVGKPIHIIQLSDELIRVSVDIRIQYIRISVEVTWNTVKLKVMISQMFNYDNQRLEVSNLFFYIYTPIINLKFLRQLEIQNSTILNFVLTYMTFSRSCT